MGSSTLSLFIFVVAPIMNLLPVTLSSWDHSVEADRNALLAGPPLSCGVASDMDHDTCINKWAMELEAQGLVADFEEVWSSSLPPQLATYFEIDANIANVVDADILNTGISAAGDDVFVRLGKTKELQLTCCVGCNRGKMNKLCSISRFIPLVWPFCLQERHFCCVHNLKDEKKCECVCSGRDDCTTYQKEAVKKGKGMCRS